MKNRIRTMKRKIWTATEIEELKVMFPNHYTKVVAEHFGVGYSAIAYKAFELGLKKSESFKAEIAKIRDENLVLAGTKFRFPPNHVPDNKGKKMSPEVYAKASRTMFKKGNVPANTKYDGHLRQDEEGYWLQRVRLGKYECCHRVLWKKHYGEIPEGKIVVFKDKNKNNIVIENLELIDRVENMKRNSFIRFPNELRNAIRTLNQLKRMIYEKRNSRFSQ